MQKKQSTTLYEHEVRFYEQLAAGIALRTHDCYYGAIDLETGESLLLLEDLVAGRNLDKFTDYSVAEAELADGQIAPPSLIWTWVSC